MYANFDKISRLLSWDSCPLDFQKCFYILGDAATIEPINLCQDMHKGEIEKFQKTVTIIRLFSDTKQLIESEIGK